MFHNNDRMPPRSREELSNCLFSVFWQELRSEGLMQSANIPAPPPSLVLSSWASSKKDLIVFSPDLSDLKISVLIPEESARRFRRYRDCVLCGHGEVGP